MTTLTTIIGRSLLGIGSLSSELLPKLAARLAQANERFASSGELLAIARQELFSFEPLLAEHLRDSQLASWVAGMSSVARLFPPWLEREFQTGVRGGFPPEPPEPPKPLFSMFEGTPRLRLPIVDNAAQRLIERNILTREEFDAVGDELKQEAFTIAGDLSTETIDRMRGFLVSDLAGGTSLEGFRERVEEHLGTSPIAPGHLETVYRTNIQGALRDGRQTLIANPIVAATFPYQEYVPIHDARARHEHVKLGRLGLNGTGIYRLDDPVWDSFTPPWDYNCRCGTRLLTIERAAELGVKEAQEWLRTGRPPLNPEWRYRDIPFEPKSGFGSRGRVGAIV